MAHKLPLADIQFIADFAAFCRSKGDEEYDYTSNTNCACCQFLRHTGRASDPSVAGISGWRDKASDTPLAYTAFQPGLADALVAAEGGFVAGWRFDLLADRLEALIAGAPVVERAQ